MFILKFIWWLYCLPGSLLIDYKYHNPDVKDINDVNPILKSQRDFSNKKLMAPIYSLTLWPFILLFMMLFAIR